MRRLAVWSVLALLGLGCDGATQNPYVVTVTAINEGIPLLADVIHIDADMNATIPTDVVAVELTNRPYSSNVSVDPGVAWYDFTLRGYTVRWRRLDGGPTSGPGWNLTDFNHTEATTAVVPFRGTATTGLLIVPVAMKSSEPFVSLQGGGAIALIADIDLFGSSAINPSSEVHIPATLSVTFSNYADEEQ